MKQFLHTYYKLIIGILVFIPSIYWFYDRGVSDEKEKRETIISNKTHANYILIDSLKGVVREKNQLILNLGTDNLISENEKLQKKFESLKIQKGNLIKRSNRASETIRFLNDSLAMQKCNQEEVNKFKLEILEQQKQIDTLNIEIKLNKIELKYSKAEIENLRVEKESISKLHVQLVKKDSNLFKHIEALQKAYNYKIMAQESTGKKMKQRLYFKAYQEYEFLRSRGIPFTKQQYEIIKCLNKLDKDKVGWRIDNGDFTLTIDKNLYKKCDMK